MLNLTKKLRLYIAGGISCIFAGGILLETFSLPGVIAAFILGPAVFAILYNTITPLEEPKPITMKKLNLIESARIKLLELVALIGQEECVPISPKMAKLANNIKLVINELDANPEKIKNSTDYLDFYLESTLSIVSQYASLANKKSEETTLNHLDSLLSDIDKAYEEHYNGLLNQDKFNLTVDMKLLRSELETKGLEDKNAKI